MEEFFVIVFVALGLFGFGLAVGDNIGEDSIQKQAIERGFGEMQIKDPTNPNSELVFVWKDSAAFIEVK